MLPVSIILTLQKLGSPHAQIGHPSEPVLNPWSQNSAHITSPQSTVRQSSQKKPSFFSHSLPIVEPRPFFSMSTGWGGIWFIFCHAGSGRVGRVWSARENPLKCSAAVGNWAWALGRTDSKLLSLYYWAIMADIANYFGAICIITRKQNPWALADCLLYGVCYYSLYLPHSQVSHPFSSRLKPCWQAGASGKQSWSPQLKQSQVRQP